MTVSRPSAAVVDRLRAAGCVFAEDEARLLLDAATTTEHLDQLVGRRTAGEPLEHLLGWAKFRGLRIAVGPGVFVPRRRSGLLVERAVALAAPGAVVVDLCCGSGALGVAVASERPAVELHAADVDPAVLPYARRNVVAVGGEVHGGDLFAALPAGLRGRVAVLLANVPYVPTGALAGMPPEARDHEPRVALDGGADGLDVARRVVAGAPGWLAPGGSLLFETGEAQAPAAAELVAAGGLLPRVVADEDLGATVVTGTR